MGIKPVSSFPSNVHSMSTNPFRPIIIVIIFCFDRFTLHLYSSIFVENIESDENRNLIFIERERNFWQTTNTKFPRSYFYDLPYFSSLLTHHLEGSPIFIEIISPRWTFCICSRLILFKESFEFTFTIIACAVEKKFFFFFQFLGSLCMLTRDDSHSPNDGSVISSATRKSVST